MTDRNEPSPSGPAGPQRGRVSIVTFGFKYGAAPTNYWFDVSFLKNPARLPDVGLFASSEHPGVRDFVLRQPKAQAFLDCLEPMVSMLSECDDDVRIGIGCNAGRHRSRVIAGELQARLRSHGIYATLHHREEG